LRGQGIAQYAEGGFFSGGYRIVGENGPEIEYTGPSQILNNSQSKALLDMTGVIRELQFMRGDIKNSDFVIRQTLKQTEDNQALAYSQFTNRLLKPLLSDLSDSQQMSRLLGSIFSDLSYRDVEEPVYAEDLPNKIISSPKSKTTLLDTSELLAELKKLGTEITLLRQESKAADQSLAINTNRAAKVLERWDIDGQPAERDLG